MKQKQIKFKNQTKHGSLKRLINTQSSGNRKRKNRRNLNTAKDQNKKEMFDYRYNSDCKIAKKYQNTYSHNNKF